MEDTYLDAQAMLKRINTMQSEAQDIFKEIEKTRDVMEQLKEYFEGVSANRLQNQFNEIAATYKDLYEYLKRKAALMDQLTKNTEKTDEGE